MSILSTDIEYRYSNTDADGGNQLAQLSPDESLGKFVATTVWADATLNSLFADLSGDDNLAQVNDYRCIFVFNKHTTLTWTSVKLWLVSEVASGASIAIGVDTTAATAINSASTQALTVAATHTAPVGVTFSSPTSKGAGLSLGDILPGRVRAFWVRRRAAGGAALTADGVTLRCEGDTL